MPSPIRGRTLVLPTALILGLALGLPCSGQQSPVTMAATVPAHHADAAKAAELRARAVDLTRDVSQWDKVIELYADAAHAAPLEDPERVHDLAVAGHLSAALRRMSDAEAYLEEAASTALAFGDLSKAGDLLVSAAFAAGSRGAVQSARALLDRADLIAHSPLLSPEECDCLQRRVALYGEGLSRLVASAIR